MTDDTSLNARYDREDVDLDREETPEELLAAGFTPEELEAVKLADPELAKDLEGDVDEFADEASQYVPPPPAADESADTAPSASFLEAGVDLHALDDLNLSDRVSVLERLGPAHFRSKGFSFMGFLQTVYDHVATEVKSPTPAEKADDSSTVDSSADDAPVD